MSNINKLEKFKSCNILGLEFEILNLTIVKEFLEKNIDDLKGKYICVSNAHTTVMSYEDKDYNKIQKEAVLRLSDGAPLSIISKMKGFNDADRVTGPDLMKVLFEDSDNNQLKHYFYGSTEETLGKLEKELVVNYPNIRIVGKISPPFRELTIEEDIEIISRINQLKPDIVWVGLGAPKQEIWMNEHKEKLEAVMIGVGAGFDYCAGNIKRAPRWMQKCSLEWLYRLMQEPKRLFKRYVITNSKFIYYNITDIFRK